VGILYQKVKIRIYMHHLCDYYYYFAYLYTDYHVNNHNNYYPTICINYYGFLHLVLYTLEFGQKFLSLKFRRFRFYKESFKASYSVFFSGFGKHIYFHML